MYASNTVVHMLTGHAYARALRAHLISSAAIVSILLETPGCMSKINLDKLRIMHQGLLKGDISTDSVVNEECVQQNTNTIDNLEDDIATKSRTAKMWMNYVKCVSVIRLFMRAERTGDWNLHLYCISEMIPLFHAAGHFAYMRNLLDCTCNKWAIWHNRCHRQSTNNSPRRVTLQSAEPSAFGVGTSRIKPLSRDLCVC